MLFNLKAFRPGKVSSILLTGVDGSGKSALAGRFVDETKKYFDLTRIISPDILKKPFIEQLENLWQDAQSVDKALIVLDGLESLLKILNEYKYDDRAMTILNTMLTSQTKGKIVVLSTMDHDSAELFERINPTSKWSMKATITDLSTKDMEEILRAQRIKGEIIAPLFQNLPISKVLDILNIDDAPTFTYEDWSERITMLT